MRYSRVGLARNQARSIPDAASNAASILGGDMWFAGERLQARADQDRWLLRSDFERMTESSRERIANCLNAAAKAQRPTKCEVTLKPPTPEAR